MIAALELAGSFAAHAIWCVADGDLLIPMLAYTNAAGERTFERLVLDDTEAAVAYGRQKLQSNEMNARDAVLLFDGRIGGNGEKLDAILIEIRAYQAPGSVAMIAVPYTRKKPGALFRRKPVPFRVHKPKLLEWMNCEAFDKDSAFEVFFRGVDSHQEGSKVWNAALDESK